MDEYYDGETSKAIVDITRFVRDELPTLFSQQELDQILDGKFHDKERIEHLRQRVIELELDRRRLSGIWKKFVLLHNNGK